MKKKGKRVDMPFTKFSFPWCRLVNAMNEKKNFKNKAFTYAVTATSRISGCEISAFSKSAGAICTRTILSDRKSE